MKRIFLSIIFIIITLISYSQNKRQVLGYIDVSKTLVTKTLNITNVESGILFIYPKTMVGSGGSYSINIGADIDNDGNISDEEYTEWSNHSIVNNTTQSWDIGNLNCESLKINVTKGSLTSGKIYIVLIYKNQK